MRGTALLVVILLSTLSVGAAACTGVAIARDGHVVVGGNEDWRRWNSYVWAEPTDAESFGAVYFGYEIFGEFGPRPRYWFEFQGINEHGLFFDTFGAPFMADPSWGDNPPAPTHIERLLMRQCATVSEAIDLLGAYDLRTCAGVNEFIFRGNMQFLLADRTGAVAVVGGGEAVHMTADTFAVTNFRPNAPTRGGWPCWRHDLATAMLEADATSSMDRVAEILSETQFSCSLGYASCTRYSVVSDLTTGEIRLYYGGDFDNYAALSLLDLCAAGLERTPIEGLVQADSTRSD